MELSRYLKVYPAVDKPGRILLYATRRCALLELSESLWERVCLNGDISEGERETLLRLGVLVPSRQTEREEMLNTFVHANAQKRPFSLLVTLTLECNLACPYCFEDPFRGHFNMSEETAEDLLQLLSGKMRNGLDVKIDFYGGEALLALPRLKQIAGELQRMAGLYHVNFEFSIISNATLLTRKTVQELLPLGLTAVRTTLDGPPEIHNRQRPFVSGSGSFKTILANIKDLAGLIEIDLGGNYTRENYTRFPEMLDLLISEGITPQTIAAVGFFPVFPKVDGKGGDCSSTCASSSEPWAIEAGLFLRGEILKRGFNAPKPRMAGCMVEFDNDFVVACDGALFKCPAFMGYEELKVGTLRDGVIDYRDSHGLDHWKNEACLECAYLPLCFGGCRFFQRLNKGSIDAVECRKGLLDATLEGIIQQEQQYRHLVKCTV